MERIGLSRSIETGPLAKLGYEHALQLELCDALEHIADGLPDCVDRRLAHSAATVLDNGLALYVRFEDEQLFPRLRSRGGHALDGALVQLEGEHVRDQALALEIAEQLDTLCAQGACRNPEMLGYMLRGFFDGRRRHIAWENTVVISIAPSLLRPIDMTELQAWMTAENWQAAFDKWSRTVSDWIAVGRREDTPDRK